uniref:Uncharacterized protein n=1 Tax=viral metagenome TaxID=1070528 RepID=A0A6M3XU07_9ZZZZ
MGYGKGKEVRKHKGVCPILALFGVANSNSGYSPSLTDPSRNWIKQICIEKCPLPDCLEGYSNKEDNKKFCLSRSELITVIQNIIKLVKERRRGKG